MFPLWRIITSLAGVVFAAGLVIHSEPPTADRLSSGAATAVRASADGGAGQQRTGRIVRTGRHHPSRVWHRLADCESGDPGAPGSARWNADTGNGYHGGLQFSRRSWAAVGGAGAPHHAGPDEQVEMARRLHRRQGFAAWPECARRLGLR